MEIENPMVNDACWPEFDPQRLEDQDEYFRRLADEQYDEEVSACRN